MSVHNCVKSAHVPTCITNNENGYWAAIAKGTAVQVRTHFACQ